MTARITLGERVRPDHRAIPDAMYADPPAAGVGLQLDEAIERGHDAFEGTTNYPTSAPGLVTRRQRADTASLPGVPGVASAQRRTIMPAAGESRCRCSWTVMTSPE